MGKMLRSLSNFNPADLRLQIERELRGKFTLLSQVIWMTEGKHPAFTNACQ